jgi:hypothetical protein
MYETDLVDTVELKEKLDRGDTFKLVMTLGEWEYSTKHIPGSLRASTVEEALKTLYLRDEIILYDSGPPCTASRMACRILKARGRTPRITYPTIRSGSSAALRATQLPGSRRQG